MKTSAASDSLTDPEVTKKTAVSNINLVKPNLIFSMLKARWQRFLLQGSMANTHPSMMQTQVLSQDGGRHKMKTMHSCVEQNRRKSSLKMQNRPKLKENKCN